MVAPPVLIIKLSQPRLAGVGAATELGNNFIPIQIWDLFKSDIENIWSLRLNRKFVIF